MKWSDNALNDSNRAVVRLAERAAIVLHAADGLENQEIGEVTGISRQKAGRWRQRYAELGLTGAGSTAIGAVAQHEVDRRG